MSRLAILASFSGRGGVERMILNLARGIAAKGHPLDLLAIRTESLLPPEGVRVIPLGVRHAASSILPLAAYLRRERPGALLAAKDRAIRAALLARSLSRVPVPIVGRLGTHLSASLKNQPWRSGFRRPMMRYLYRHIDGIAAVSRGVAEDTRRITGLPRERIHVVPNPAWTPEIEELAGAPLDHPGFPEDLPILLGMGRLTRQKDFPTLLRAFARVRRVYPSRLVILGEGGDRPALEKLSRALGISAHVHLPGHAENPYPWLARAALFVLSSRWEGSPNALTEALALGTPCVATDCPSGPREILQEGRFGPLVAVGDDRALARAMLDTLENPLPRETLREAAAPYTLERSVEGYLRILGL